MHDCLENNSINFKEGTQIISIISAGVVLEAVRLRVSQFSQSDVHIGSKFRVKVCTRSQKLNILNDFQLGLSTGIPNFRSHFCLDMCSGWTGLKSRQISNSRRSLLRQFPSAVSAVLPHTSFIYSFPGLTSRNNFN